MKSDNKFTLVLIIVFTMSFFYNLHQHRLNKFHNDEINRLYEIINRLREDSISNSESLNEQNVWNYIQQINLKCPEIVLRQCLLESGYFTSNLCTSNNNILGLRCAKSRKYTYIGEKNGYANFSSWKSCIDDYKLLQDKHFKGKTHSDYYKWLDKFYAENDMYISQLKSIRLKIKK